MWIRAHPIRTAVYAVLIAGALFVALRAGAIAGWVAAGPAGRAVAGYLGIAWRAADLRIGWNSTEISRLEATVAGDPPVRIAAASVRVDGLSTVHSTKIAFGETVTVEQATIGPSGGGIAGAQFANAVAVAGARATLSPPRFTVSGVSAFGVRVESAAAGPLELEPHAVRLATIEVAGVQAAAVRDASGRWNLEQAASLVPAGRRLAREGDSLRRAYQRFIPRLRTLLLWSIVAVAVLLAAAKLLLTARGIPARLVSALAAVAAPFLFRSLGIVPSLIAAAVVAAALFAAIYLRTSEWHQKVEPLAADLTGPPLLSILLAAYAFSLPALPEVPSTLRIDSIRIDRVDASVDDGRNRIRIDAPLLRIEDVLAAGGTHVQRITASNLTATGDGWRVAVPEVRAEALAASSTAASVQRIEFGGHAESDIARRRLARYSYLPAALRRQLRVAFSGAASAAFPPVRFTADTRFAGEGVDVSLRAEGGAESVEISRIRAASPSLLRIAGGSARIGFNGASSVHLTGLAAGRFTARDVDVRVRPGGGEARLRTLELPNVNLDEIFASATYARNRLALDASARRLLWRSAVPDINAGAPRIDAQVSGWWRNSVLDGELRLASSRFAIERPLLFSADAARGELRLPRQSLAIRQSAVPRAPETVAADISATARMEASGPRTELRLHIPRLQPEIDPLTLDLRDLDISATLGGGARRIIVETGWNRLGYPAVPRYNRLESIGRLELHLRAKGELLNPVLYEGWTAPQLPRLPERFRIAGLWPHLRILTENEEAISPEGLSVELQSLAAPDSRIRAATLDFALRGFRGRRLDLHSRIRLEDELASVHVTGGFAGAPRFELKSAPGRIDIALPAWKPEAGGFHGRISGLRAAASYSSGRISKASGSLTVEAGPLFDGEIGSGPFGGVKARLSAPAKISVLMESSSASAEIDAPAFAFNAESKAGPIAFDGGIGGAARIVQSDEPWAILNAVERTGAAAAPHLRRARDLFQLPAAVEWRVAARHTPGNPFLRFTRDAVELRGAFEAGGVRTGEVAAALLARGRDLFVDAALPLESISVPVQLALRDPFPAPDAKAALLWDAAALEKTWAGFTPRHAVHAPLIERRRQQFGGASLLQLIAPSAPLRVVAALGDRIQLHVPLEARALFGSIGATAQAELAWSAERPVLSGRLDGLFRNVQAGALGLADADLHNPFLEDAFDGSFRGALNGLSVTPESIERWRVAPGSFDQHDRVSLSLAAERSPQQPGPGVVQLGFDTRVRLVNQVLQRASDKLRLHVPPQLLTYRGLRASFEAIDGVIQTKSPLLELSGVKILTTELLDVNGCIRIKLGGRDAGEMPLRHLIRSAWGGEE